MKVRARPYSPRHRLVFVLAVLGLVCLALVARAAQLQLVEQDFYQQQGDARHLREMDIPASRGMITDRNGEPLAISSPVETIKAVPREVLEHPDRLPELARALDIPPAVLEQRLTERLGLEATFLRRHMSPDAAERVIALNIPGISLEREYRRFYPHGEVMAHVLGFTNIDDVGQEGLELAFNDWLTGTVGTQRVIRDRKGRVVEYVDLVRAAEPGKDLVLSIDRRLQYLAYRELKTTLSEWGASHGSVVVLDVPTGEILAMVNLPSYNPNARGGSRGDVRRNRAVTDQMEPGSVMKSLTLAAALESGKFTPASMIETAPGYQPLPGGYTARDFRNYGTLSMAGVLAKSSNVGATRIAWQLERPHLYDVYHRFGLGQTTGSGFPGESAGSLKDVQKWGPTETATISYGYGLTVTALQLARAYAAIGNGGRIRETTFVKGTDTPSEQVIDPRIARELMAMMETVVSRDGTGSRAAVLGYRVAGKTGTARKAEGGGYSTERRSAVFAGLVPASAPRFATVVVVHDVYQADAGGAVVAAPVFHRVMEGALRLMDVPPDAIEQWMAAQAARKAGPQVAVAPAPGTLAAPTAAPTAEPTAEALR